MVEQDGEVRELFVGLWKFESWLQERKKKFPAFCAFLVARHVKAVKGDRPVRFFLFFFPSRFDCRNWPIRVLYDGIHLVK